MREYSNPSTTWHAEIEQRRARAYAAAQEIADTILHGREAIDYAEREGLTLRKHADPTEDARDGLTIDEAEGVAAIDPALIWCVR
jgi:hypothetical protein